MNETIIDPSARAILDTNFKQTNVIPISESADKIIGTLDTILNQLTCCCGPTAKYTMLVNSYSTEAVFEPNVFTRDGIRILNSMEFMSPMERFIKEMIGYIGTRVDNNAKDGTTTSMIIATAIVREFLRSKIANNNTDFGLNMYQMKQLLHKYFANIVDELKRVSDETTKEIKSHISGSNENDIQLKYAGYVAYMQAASSSGGNLDLAKVMKSIFEKSPECTWEFMSHYNSVKETGDSFSVEVDEFDIKLYCVQASNAGLNKFLNTEYEDEDVTVLIFPDSLDEMSHVTRNLTTYLKTFPTDKSLNVIATYFAPSILQLVNNELNKLRNVPIVLWQYGNEHQVAGVSKAWSLTVAAAISGAEAIDPVSGVIDDSHVFVAKRVHWSDAYLKLYGVLETENDVCLHPFYNHPEKATKLYTDTLNSIQKQLDMYRNGHKTDGVAYGLFVQAMNNMISFRRPKLRLGGPMHEQMANIDVAQDTEGAIMSSLKHGFVYNGISDFYAAVRIVSEKTIENYKSNPSYSKFITEFSKYLCTGIEIVHNILLKNKHDDSCEKYTYFNVFNNNAYNLFDYMKDIDAYDDVDKLAITYPVMQPIQIYIELMKRIEEMLLKLIMTDNIVVFGGVYIGNKDIDTESK